MTRYHTILFFLRRHKRIYLPLLGVSIVYALLESINISVLLPLFDTALGQKQAEGTLFVMLNKVVAMMPFNDPFMNTATLAFIALVLKEIFAFVRQFMVVYGLGTAVCDVKERMLNKYSRSDYTFFLNKKQGDLTYAAMYAPGSLGRCLSYIPELMTALFMVFTIGFVLLNLSWKVTAALMGVGILFNFFTKYLSRKVSFNIGKERTQVTAEAIVTVSEFVDGIKQIKVGGVFQTWKNKYSAAVRRFKDLEIRDAFWVAIPQRLLYLTLPILLIALAMYLKNSSGQNSQVMLSKLALMGVYAFAFYRVVPFLTSFGKLRMQIMCTLPDVNVIYNMLHEKSESEDGVREIQTFQKGIHFDRVTFHYNKGQEILKDLDFTIERGKVTAIVGKSGSGKSTLVNLMLRLFRPSQGSIKLDGVALQDMKIASLTNLIGLVTQETFIYNASIRDNIVFGLQNVTQAAIIEAAKKAYAHEFIDKLPNGYETMVGDKGYKLSGGQRQRLAIARILLKNPQIIILDEATSSLDSQSEWIVQKAIDTLSKNRTVIIVSHRLSTIQHADKIIVLDQGRILEQGTHEVLMKQHGLYGRLYQGGREAAFSR